MNIKAVMCDIDGTLLNEHGEVTEKTKEAIHQLKEKGIVFGLATGREAYSVELLLEQWGIKDAVDVIVGSGGAEIIDYRHNISCTEFPLDGSLILDIIAHYKDLDVNFAIPEKGVLYAYKDDEVMQKLSKFDQIPYQVIDYPSFLTQPRQKVMIVCEEDKMPKVIERSKTFSSDQYKCASLKTASILFEYMDPRVSKSYGIQEALKPYGITMQELCVFGDADNDYEMVKDAGMGIVMNNGSEKTKQVADYITDDHNHDGIAKALIQYIL